MRQAFNKIKDIIFFYYAEKVDSYDHHKRLKICKGCEYYKQDFSLLFSLIKIPKTPQCDRCKCILKTKTKLKYERCPEDKW